MAHMRVRNTLPIVAVAMLLTACGGGGSDATTNVVAPPTAPQIAPVQPATVTGVATPDSLAVVTATNAG
jgi:hypothetical protein